MEKEVRIGVRVSEKLRDKFMSICEENSLNASSLMRKWIDDFITREEEKKVVVTLNGKDIK